VASGSLGFGIRRNAGVTSRCNVSVQDAKRSRGNQEGTYVFRVAVPLLSPEDFGTSHLIKYYRASEDPVFFVVTQNRRMESPGDGNWPLDELEAVLGYRFGRRELLRQALTHRSYAVEQQPVLPDNERLEFLGDAVLDLVVSHLLFDLHGGEYREGDLTRMRASLVNEGRLASQARILGLGRHVRLGRGELKSGGKDKPSILADVFEAVIGAIYLDRGFPACLGFVGQCFGELLDEAPGAGLDQDYKSTLQEFTQARFREIPFYEVEGVAGPGHETTFTVVLHLHGRILSRGSGRSKKEAEQEAARKALAILAA